MKLTTGSHLSGAIQLPLRSFHGQPKRTNAAKRLCWRAVMILSQMAQRPLSSTKLSLLKLFCSSMDRGGFLASAIAGVNCKDVGIGGRTMFVARSGSGYFVCRSLVVASSARMSEVRQCVAAQLMIEKPFRARGRRNLAFRWRQKWPDEMDEAMR
jgi:hypothetical protein